MKKILAFLMIFVLCVIPLSACGSSSSNDTADDTTQAAAEETTTAAETEAETEAEEVVGEFDYATTNHIDIDDYLWEITAETTLTDAVTYEVRNFKIIQSMEELFDEETYTAYYTKIAAMKVQKTAEAIIAAITARQDLIQNDSVEDRIIFLWDEDNMPIIDGESYTEEELDEGVLDGYGFVPLLVEYLIDDPTQAKGNIIMVSGGAMSNRSNASEGYPAAEVFNELGYNVFLLQRRISPYSDMDIFMDFQRAVRIVRSTVEQEGYGGADMIAGCGFSGGAVTILGAVSYCYGSLTPVDEGATSYVPDELDEINSDLDAALIIYSPNGYDYEGNDNIPAMYICVGAEDGTGAYDYSQTLYEQMQGLGVSTTLNVIEGAGHGYGVGGDDALNGVEGCELWPADADAFMQANLGYSGN